jgi:hypothetical protein
MLQCYVLTFGRSVTAFSAPLRSPRPGQMPRSPHPKAGPDSCRHPAPARTKVSNQLIALSHDNSFLLAGKLILQSNLCEYQISAKQTIGCVDSRGVGLKRRVLASGMRGALCPRHSQRLRDCAYQYGRL